MADDNSTIKQLNELQAIMRRAGEVRTPQKTSSEGHLSRTVGDLADAFSKLVDVFKKTPDEMSTDGGEADEIAAIRNALDRIKIQVDDVASRQSEANSREDGGLAEDFPFHIAKLTSETTAGVYGFLQQYVDDTTGDFADVTGGLGSGTETAKELNGAEGLYDASSDTCVLLWDAGEGDYRFIVVIQQSSVFPARLDSESSGIFGFTEQTMGTTGNFIDKPNGRSMGSINGAQEFNGTKNLLIHPNTFIVPMYELTNADGNKYYRFWQMWPANATPRMVARYDSTDGLPMAGWVEASGDAQ